MSASFGTALRRALRQPAFLTVALVLLVAAVSINGATSFLQLHFKKEKVDLRKKLTEVPARLGPWQQVTTDMAVTHEIEDVLGTKDYIYRFYVDTRRVHQDVIDQFKDKDERTQREYIAAVQARDPHAVVYCAVTYYSGMVDTVAHIPDRCYVADGYEPASYDVVHWSSLQARPGGGPGHGTARFIKFEDQTPSRKSVTKNVAYFFHSNGDYTNDPHDVRLKLQNLFETHGYYAKVELLMITGDRAGAATQMNDFLASALPELERCWPDWKQVKAAAKTSSSAGKAE